MQPSEHENNAEMEQKTTVMSGHCPFLLPFTIRDSAPREGAETRRTPAMLMNLAERENETTNPIIPGGVKRRPGIHAEVMDPHFRGNDSGLVRRACEYADRERIPPAAPSFRAQ